MKNAAPDGLTILYTPFAAVTIYPFTFRQLDYDPFTELQPLSQIVKYDFALAVGPDIPVKTPKELVAWLKANPGKAQFGSPGAGALPHFFGIMFGHAAGVDMTHIAYRGTAPALPDLMSGQIPIMSSTTSDLLELHKAGKIRILATSDTERSIPDVPTFKESGFDIVGTGWFGMFLPAKTPPDIAGRLSKAIMAAVALPEVQKALRRIWLQADRDLAGRTRPHSTRRCQIVGAGRQGVRLRRGLVSQFHGPYNQALFAKLSCADICG